MEAHFEWLDKDDFYQLLKTEKIIENKTFHIDGNLYIDDERLENNIWVRNCHFFFYAIEDSTIYLNSFNRIIHLTGSTFIGSQCNDRTKHDWKQYYKQVMKSKI